MFLTTTHEDTAANTVRATRFDETINFLMRFVDRLRRSNY